MKEYGDAQSKESLTSDYMSFKYMGDETPTRVQRRVEKPKEPVTRSRVQNNSVPPPGGSEQNPLGASYSSQDRAARLEAAQVRRPTADKSAG